jgi:hypothetical protein
LHHHAYNSNKSPTRCNNFPVYYPDVYSQLNMFRAFFRPSSGAQWLHWQPLVLPSYRGDSCALFVVGPAGRLTRPQTEHDCHHDKKVKSEAANAVTELLMMGGKTPGTCWTVSKHQDNKLENCCIWLVIYLKSMFGIRSVLCLSAERLKRSVGTVNMLQIRMCMYGVTIILTYYKCIYIWWLVHKSREPISEYPLIFVIGVSAWCQSHAEHLKLHCKRIYVLHSGVSML